jgi:hypothetical protein
MDWGGGIGPSIAQTVEDIGRIRAAQTLQQGQIWGGALSNIANLIAQQPQRQALEQERQARALELQSVAQDRQLKVQALQRDQAGRQKLVQMLGDPQYRNAETGDTNDDAIYQALTPYPETQAAWEKSATSRANLRKSAAELAKMSSDARTLAGDKLFEAVHNAPDASSAHAAIADMAAISKDPIFAQMANELSPLIDAWPPDQYRQRADSLYALTKQGQTEAAEARKPLTVGPEQSVTTLGRVQTGQPPLIQGRPADKTELDTFKDVYASNALGVGKHWNDLSPQQQQQGLDAFNQRTTSLQSENVLLDGKPAQVTFNPKTGKRTNAAGEDVTGRTRPLPPASQLVAAAPVDPDNVAYWVKQVQNDPTQWSMLANNKPLQQAVQAGLAKAGVDLSKITSQSRAMAETAKELLPHIDRVRDEAKAIDQMGLMGPIRGRWRDLASGKLSAEQMFGSTDKARAVGKFLTDVGLLETGAARAHGGARGGGSPMMLQHMESIMGAGTKDLPTFLGNLDAVSEWMQGYANMVPTNRDAGGATPPPPAMLGLSYEDYLKRKRGK